MRNFERVFRSLVELRATMRGQNVKRVKEIIGDSLQNNRTLTVNQTIRYLMSVGLFNLAETVEVSSNILENQIIRRRKNRTDAIDLSELVNTYRKVVMNGRSDTYRRRIGNAVGKVG